METLANRKKLRRKQLRDDTKTIEAILHPCPIINGIEICHEHTRNGKIIFTAWRSENQIDNGGKQLILNRFDILSRPEFYILYDKDMKWLAE